MTIIDPSTKTGAIAARRLAEDRTIWFISVTDSNRPVPSLVWFVRDGDRVLVYSREDARRVRHIARRSRVALLTLDRPGEPGLVLEGSAAVDPDAPRADANEAYLAKYRERITGPLHSTPAQFAARYPVAIWVRLTRLQTS